MNIALSCKVPWICGALLLLCLLAQFCLQPFQFIACGYLIYMNIKPVSCTVWRNGIWRQVIIPYLTVEDNPLPPCSGRFIGGCPGGGFSKALPVSNHQKVPALVLYYKYCTDSCTTCFRMLELLLQAPLSIFMTKPWGWGGTHQWGMSWTELGWTCFYSNDCRALWCAAFGTSFLLTPVQNMEFTGKSKIFWGKFLCKVNSIAVVICPHWRKVLLGGGSNMTDKLAF